MFPPFFPFFFIYTLCIMCGGLIFIFNIRSVNNFVFEDPSDGNLIYTVLTSLTKKKIIEELDLYLTKFPGEAFRPRRFQYQIKATGAFFEYLQDYKV